MQVNQIAQNIFLDAGFDLVDFELQNQYNCPARITPLMMRAGEQMAIIQVKDGMPTTFYYRLKAYTFTNDVYIYSCDETITSLFAKKCLESHTACDGSNLYLFNVKN